MTESQDALRLGEVPEAIREPLTQLSERLRAGLRDDLRSITVVGSSLTEDYKPGVSDINTVLVLKTHTTAALNIIASLARPMGKKKLSPPLLMTTGYIERSRDVFGVELLDFQLTHETILGDDPFASLSFEKSDVRLQCERELKAMLIRLRQGYIAAAASKKLVRDVLIATAKGLAPLLRALLWLKDVERPKPMAPTFRRAADTFNVELDAVVAVEQWRYEKRRLDEYQIQTAFEKVYAAVDRLAAIVDALEL